ncbi:hypothetical protein [Aquisalimonas sp.]|uniref:hypothetical protein n=1 Tax=Aquisalimonas sp. TaxID=1872621 RepID=UPI0025BED7BC|nr:hypothetical protein [Aquisalimonas sp.]
MTHAQLQLTGSRSPRTHRHLALLLLLPLLGGCQAITERLCETADYCHVSPEEDATDLGDDLLNYAVMVEAMNPTALRAEDQRLRASIDDARCTDNHVRLALVSTRLEPNGELPNTVMQGVAQCREATDKRPARAALAFVLHEAHEHRAAKESRVAELEHALDQKEALNRALEGQLEALKAIERSILERNRD